MIRGGCRFAGRCGVIGLRYPDGFFEEPFTQQHAQHCALVRKLEFLDVCVAAAVQATDHFPVVGLGFDDEALCAAVVQEQVVRDRWHPRGEKRPTAVMRFADEDVPAAIIVLGVVVGGDTVFLGPVRLEIGEWD